MMGNVVRNGKRIAFVNGRRTRRCTEVAMDARFEVENQPSPLGDLGRSRARPGDACAFIDGVSVIDKARTQAALGLTEDLLGCKQYIQRVARATGPGMYLTRSHRWVWVTRCSAITTHSAGRLVASEKRTESSNVRDRTPSASDSDRDIRRASDLVERGACCQRPRLRLTRKTDRDFNIHLNFTSRTKGCTGAAIPGEF